MKQLRRFHGHSPLPRVRGLRTEPPLSPRKCSLLIVDDEPYILPTLSALLSDEFEVLTSDCAEAAQETLGRRSVELILTDQKMPRVTGVQLLEWVKEHAPKTIRLLMTGYAELEDAVEAINRGQVYHYILKPWRTDELLQILRDASDTYYLERSREQLLEELRCAKVEMEQRVVERTQALGEANHLLQQRTRELETLALTDPLTGLLNRRAIDDVARLEIKRHARYRSPLALGLIDADHFREINRNYLLPGGDQVLVGLAKTFTSSLRTVDAVGRIGREQFLVVAPETNLEGAGTLAERIRVAVEKGTFTYKDQTIAVTVSIGFAVAEVGIIAEYDQMKHLAAAALAEAKATGRNRCVLRALEAPKEPTGSS